MIKTSKMDGSLKSKLASFKKAYRPSLLYTRLKRCDSHLYMVTFWACMGFIGLGCTQLVFGPTLLDLAEHLEVGVDVLAIMFTCRAVGGALGSVSSGVVMDKATNYSYTILCLMYLFCMTSTAVIPLSVHIAMLGVLMTVNGIAIGAFNNGTHAVLIKLWRDKVGASMQALHFCVAFGFFIIPLVVKRFVSNQARQTLNRTSFQCGGLNDTLESLSQNIDLSNVEVDNSTLCVLEISRACDNVSGSSLTITDNCTIIIDDKGFEVPNVAWTYWIASTVYVPSLAAFIYFATSKELRRKRCKHKQLNVSNASHGTNQNMKIKRSSKQNTQFLVLLFTLLFIFMFVYLGVEVAYGSLIFTVAVTGELNFSKQDAALLTSVFGGAFAFSRLFLVLLSLCKVRASVMMLCNLSGCCLASLILIFYPHNSVAVWIGSGVLGASYASIYPTTMTWMSENTVATGKATSVLVAAGTLGDITIPSIVGVIVARVSPDSLFYITFGGVLFSSMVVIVLFLVTCLYKKKICKNHQHQKRTVVTYKKLTEDNIDISEKSEETIETFVES